MHKPVLLEEVIKYLEPKKGQRFIDCTFGWGGHTEAIARKIEPGKILAIELDKSSLAKAKDWVLDNIVLVQGSFADLKTIVEKNQFGRADGILFDLGLSSWQLEKSGRGFSFRKDEPLDMRFGDSELTAAMIISQFTESELARILKEYGQERYAKRIAKAIYRVRKKQRIETTFQLVEVIKQAVPFHKSSIHFATKTFQALRIAVNNELENIKKALPQAVELLKQNGQLAVISFHSLEDRIVKNFFRDNKDILEIITKKPIRPSKEEIKINPRSRSAKLRVAKKNK